jgi:hypothetical protein
MTRPILTAAAVEWSESARHRNQSPLLGFSVCSRSDRGGGDRTELLLRALGKLESWLRIQSTQGVFAKGSQFALLET